MARGKRKMADEEFYKMMKQNLKMKSIERKKKKHLTAFCSPP
jgi:hypothetical protein